MMESFDSASEKLGINGDLKGSLFVYVDAVETARDNPLYFGEILQQKLVEMQDSVLEHMKTVFEEYLRNSSEADMERVRGFIAKADPVEQAFGYGLLNLDSLILRIEQILDIKKSSSSTAAA